MSGAGGERDAARAQTLPDFAVGVAIFLVTTTAIFLFVPQLALPYDDQEDSLVVQRAAADLGDDLLAGEAPSSLDAPCTVAFFERAAAGDCPFEGGDEPLTAELGVASTYSVNVTLRDAPSDAPESTVCRADDAETIGDCESGETSRTLAVGPPLPEDEGSVAVARRSAFVDDEEVVLEIGVW